jgi:hypothetical protein
MGMMINTTVLKHRLNNPIVFAYFQDHTLYYKCEDGFVFPVPLADTINSQGNSPKFYNEERGMMFMKWICKAMVAIQAANTKRIKENTARTMAEKPSFSKCDHIPDYDTFSYSGSELIIDTSCRECGVSGSFIVSPEDINWE